MKSGVQILFKFKKKQETDKAKTKNQIIELLSNRIIIMGVLLTALFCVLIYRLFVLQIIQGDEHLANFNYKIKKTIEISGARGNIYDCKGKILAYNQLAYTVTLENSEKTSKIAQERTAKNGKNGPKVTENQVKNEVIYKLVKVLEQNGDTINYSLPMTVNSKGKLKFTVSGSALTRFKKDIYGITNIDNLSGDEKKKAEKYLNSTPEKVYEYLRSGKDGPQGTGNMFDISDSYSTEDTLKIMSVRYDVFMNRYSQTTPITVAANISDKSIAAISEHEEEYPGVSIKADSLRKYNDAKYFSSILGYTGVISESELKELNADNGKYEANDVVGKTGIEKTMESTLQGKKGQKDVLVDNLGKIIKTVKTTKASAGNNVYLTIDADLQRYAYNILERRLTGRTPVNRHLFFISKTCFEHFYENPLCPFIKVWICCIYFHIPVINGSDFIDLSFDILNVGCCCNLRVCSHLDRIVLCWKTKCIPSHWMNQIISLKHFVTAPYITDHI